MCSLIDAARREIVEGVRRHPDDVIADEGRALARALLGMLERAFPLAHRPTRIIIGRHLREARTEIDLPAPARPEASGPLDPALRQQEPRVGQESVSNCRSRCSPYTY